MMTARMLAPLVITGLRSALLSGPPCPRILAATLGIALAVVSGGAPAGPVVTDTAGATDASDLAEIVVTATRHEERLQDIPSSITAISGANLANRTVFSMTDALVSVPDLQISKPYGDGGAPNFVIRGISSTDSALAASKPVALYFDEGVRSFTVFEIMPLFDIDRIEVLRGPQGTLYGRNATAGAVNIISKTPGFDTEGYLTVGYGNFDEITAQGAFQTPLIDNVLSARVAFTRIYNEGVNEQLTPGLKNTDQTNIVAVRGSLFFQPAPAFDATLRLTYVRSGGRNSTDYPSGLSAAAYSAFGAPALATIPGMLRQGVGFFQNASFSAPDRDIESEGINLIAHWHISDEYSLTSVTTYDIGHWNDTEDDSGLPIRMDYTQTKAMNDNQFVQEIRLVSKLGGPFDWQAGLMHTQDTAFPELNWLFDAAPQCGAACQFGFPDGGYGIYEHNSFTQRRSDDSGYLRGEYKVLPTVKFFAGVRQSYDHLGVSNYSACIGDSTSLIGFGTCSVPSFVDQSKYANFTNNSKEAGLDWNITNDFLAYVSFKQGYRTGAVNSGAVFSPAEITIAPPELVNSYEAGIKSALLDRKLIANFSIFEADYRNQQIQQAVYVNGALIYPLLSIPKARIRGVEVEASIRPIPEVELSANVSFLDPTYTEGTFSGVSIVGNQMVNSAKASGSLNGDFTLYSGGADKVHLNVNGTYTSAVHYDVLETSSITQSPWWVWNSRLYWDHGNTEVAAYAKNLFDAKYITIGYNAPPVNYDLRGAPRQYGLQVTQRF